MLLSSCFMLFQAAVPATPLPTAAAAVQDPSALIVRGAAQAPTQPRGRSSAEIRRVSRPSGTAGRSGPGGVMVRVGDLSTVRGQESNKVQGIGLVTGLQGTGDTAVAARQAVKNLLLVQGITLDLGTINAKNVAVVWVEATFPPGVKPGTGVDVRVSSLYDCPSLVGGNLIRTELLDSTGRIVYATAAGPVTTGAFSFSGDGAEVARNHLTVGTIPLGAKVEREVPTQLVSDQGLIYLDMHAMKGSFGNAVKISDAINEIFTGAADAVDAMTVRVAVPADLPPRSHVAFVTALLAREIEPDTFARIVINERTGTIVMGEGVRISRGAITKGNLTVTIAETPEASQPGPFSEGTTEVLPRTNVLVEEEDRPLSIVNGAVTLQEVVEVLNVLGVTPQDMIQILQSMVHAGMLHAQIVVL